MKEITFKATANLGDKVYAILPGGGDEKPNIVPAIITSIEFTNRIRTGRSYTNEPLYECEINNSKIWLLETYIYNTRQEAEKNKEKQEKLEQERIEKANKQYKQEEYKRALKIIKEYKKNKIKK